MKSDRDNYGSILEEGDKFYHKGDYGKALVCYDKVLDIESKNALAFRNKGILLINLERFEEAITHFDKILEKDPNDVEILCRKGIAMEMVGNYDKALVCYDKVLDIESKNALAFRNKGILLINLERFEEAITHFDKILEKDPNDVEILFSKALALELLGRGEESISFYIKSLSIKPENKTLLHEFCFHFINRLKMENPMELYEKITRIYPNDPFATMFKQLIESEKKIEQFYKNYLNRNPDFDEIKYFQRQIIERKSIEWVENEIKNSVEAQTILRGKEYEPAIVRFYRKYLDRRNVDRDGINYYKSQILNGKSLEWVENEIKNSVEAKQLPYWQDE